VCVCVCEGEGGGVSGDWGVWTDWGRGCYPAAEHYGAELYAGRLRAYKHAAAIINLKNQKHYITHTHTETHTNTHTHTHTHTHTVNGLGSSLIADPHISYR